jgi:TfoX/Sxy family transcriptional regulator of competence genes
MTAKKEKSDIPASKLESYDRLILTIPSLDRKGATVPYTSVNGHMFSFFNKDGAFGLRLPGETKDRFLKKYKTKLLEAYEMVMKEYVVVSDELLENTKELESYFKISYEFVNSLKPKQTKKLVS